MPVYGSFAGGQLALMDFEAAINKLGLRTALYAEPGDNPAEHLAHTTILGEYRDFVKVGGFAKGCTAIGFDWENVPVETIEYAMTECVVRPSPEVLRISQDRHLEKDLADRLGIPIPAVLRIGLQDPAPRHEYLDHLLRQGWGQGILKTRRFGYDGKGQKTIYDMGSLHKEWEELKHVPCIVESYVPFDYECSIIVARSTSGKMVCYPAVKNTHEKGILRQTVWCPDLIPREIETKAQEYAMRLTEHLSVVGLLAVEFFVIERDRRVIFNEMAPRPHNSGHWTIEGCRVSQFENHVRAVMGMEVLDPIPLWPCTMVNVLGREIDAARLRIYDPNETFHDYGKKETREGRKMGHITRVEEAEAILATEEMCHVPTV